MRGFDPLDCDDCRFGYNGADTCPASGKHRACLNGQRIEGGLPAPPPPPPAPRADLRDPVVRELYEAFRLERRFPYHYAMSNQDRADFNRFVQEHRQKEKTFSPPLAE